MVILSLYGDPGEGEHHYTQRESRTKSTQSRECVCVKQGCSDLSPTGRQRKLWYLGICCWEWIILIPSVVFVVTSSPPGYLRKPHRCHLPMGVPIP